MPWMIEVFRRADRSWIMSYHTGNDEAAAKAVADTKNAVNDGYYNRATYYDARPYDQKIKSTAPDAPADWGYEDHRCICATGFGMNLSCPVHKPG